MEQLTMTEKMREKILKNVSDKMTDVSSAATESASDLGALAKNRQADRPILPDEKKKQAANTDGPVSEEESDDRSFVKKKSTSRICRFSALQGILAAAACTALVFLMRGFLVQRRPDYTNQVSVMSGTTAAADEAAPASETAEAEGRSAVSIANGMADVSSVQELSKAVGFDVPDISNKLTEVLSFTSRETVYTSYWGEMAQITYRGTISDPAAGDSGKSSRKDPAEGTGTDSDSTEADHESDDAPADRGSKEASDEICFRVSEGTEDNSGDYNTYADVRTVTVGKIKVTLKGDEEAAAVLAIWSSDGYSYSLSAPARLTDSEWKAMVMGISGNH